MLIFAAIAALSVHGPTPAAGLGHLSLGSKHWAPSITSLTGAGTANAVAIARVTRAEIEGWCANWSPGDSGCTARELATPEAHKTYRASADCTRGRITPVDGNTYTLAGRWDNSDIGGGRSRWRDASGRIVGRDNARVRYVLFEDKTFFNIVDFLTANILLPLGGVLTALFAAHLMKRQSCQEELQMGRLSFNLWYFVLRNISPIAVGIVLLHAVGAFRWMGIG
jgi:hypothetical protein